MPLEGDRRRAVSREVRWEHCQQRSDWNGLNRARHAHEIFTFHRVFPALALRFTIVMMMLRILSFLVASRPMRAMAVIGLHGH